MATENAKKWEFKSEKVSTIQVQTDSGSIVLSTAEGSLINAEVTGEYNTEKCEVTSELKDSRLVLTAKSRRKWFWRSSNCKTGFNVSAPANKKIIVKSGAGHIEIGSFTAGVDSYSGAGMVEFKNTSGQISVKTGAGTVIGDIYSENMDVKSGAGTVNLSWTKTPEKGLCVVKSGAGATVLSFPAGSKVSVNFKSGAGSLKNELGDNPQAGFRLDVKTGAGSLHIKKH